MSLFNVRFVLVKVLKSLGTRKAASLVLLALIKDVNRDLRMLIAEKNRIERNVILWERVLGLR